MHYIRDMRLILCLLPLMAGCGGLTALPPEETAIASAGGLAGVTGGFGNTRIMTDQTSSAWRAPAPVPLSSAEAAQAFYHQTEANAARRDAGVGLRNRQLLLTMDPGLTRPGEARQMARDRIRLQHEDLRAQRDRLRDAPYARTMGSIDY
ncbi:MAG: hypothetical protein ACK5IB_02455 [Qingshengfaniella sp.]